MSLRNAGDWQIGGSAEPAVTRRLGLSPAQVARVAVEAYHRVSAGPAASPAAIRAALVDAFGACLDREVSQ